MIIFSIISRIRGFFRCKWLKTPLILLFGMILGAFSFKFYDNYTKKSFLTSFVDNNIKLHAENLDLPNKMKDFDDFRDISSEFSRIFKDSDKFETEFQKNFEKQKKIIDEMIKKSRENGMKSDYNSSISKNVSEDSISYRLDFAGYKVDDVNVETKDGMLTFETLREEKQGGSFLGSKFKYSFSVPKDKKKPEITRNKNSIIVEFKIENKKTN